MNTLIAGWNPAGEAALLGRLADATAVGLAVLTLAWVLQTLWRRSSAAERHRLWFLSLVVAGLLPIPALLTIRTGLRPSESGTNTRPPAIRPATTRPLVGPPEEPENPRPHDATRRLPSISLPASASQPTTGRILRVPLSLSLPDGSSAWILGIWAAGAILVSARAFLGLRRRSQLLQRARPLSDPAWDALLTEASRELGVLRRVRLLELSGERIPMTCGVLRPVLLVPSRAARWSAERRRAVLAHELAHIRRRDCLTQSVAELVCVLLWFNPLAWFASHRMRIEREAASDDLVLASGWRPSDYASHLLDIAETTLTQPVPGTIAMATPSRLALRVSSIIDATTSRRSAGRALQYAALATLLVAGGFLPRIVAVTPDQPDPGSARTTSDSTAASTPSTESPDAGNGSRTPAWSEGIRRMEQIRDKEQERVSTLEQQLEARRKQLGSLELLPNGDIKADVGEAASRRIEESRSDLKARLTSRQVAFDALRALPKESLLNVLLSLKPDDALLAHLAMRLTDAEIDLDAGSDTPKDVVQKSENRVRLLRRKLDERVDGIMQAMGNEVQSLESELRRLDEESHFLRKDGEKRADSYRAYFEAKRELENHRLTLDVLNRKLAQEMFDAQVPRGTSTNRANRPF